MENLQSYGTNIAATVTAALIFGVAWCVKNKCKHSKCIGHSFCCSIEINDDEEDLERGEGREDIPREAEKELYTLHSPDHKGLHKKH